MSWYSFEHTVCPAVEVWGSKCGVLKNDLRFDLQKTTCLLSLDSLETLKNKMSQCIIRFLGTLFLISLPEIVVSDITALRDVKFTQDYNKNEMPPSHDGKPLMVSQVFENSNTIAVVCLRPIHVLLSRFYLDFILIVSR